MRVNSNNLKKFTLSEIDFGVPDANVEVLMAQKSKSRPLCVEAHVELLGKRIDHFLNGTKFIIYGQKGTGKTAILRFIEDIARKNGELTDFIIFRDKVLNEIDLFNQGGLFLISPDELKGGGQYFHIIRRMILIVMYKIISEKIKKEHENPALNEADGSIAAWFRDLSEKIRRTSAAELINFSVTSAVSYLRAAVVDQEKITKGFVKFDTVNTLRNQNDFLFSHIGRLCINQKKSMSIFVDEIHFSYRDESSIKSDAELVRDTIKVVYGLNSDYAKMLDGTDLRCNVYAGFRQEYLDHSLIAGAELSNIIQSSGVNISYATAGADANHPMFRIIASRVSRSLEVEVSPRAFINRVLANVDVREFVQSTWGKPRDAIRFFSKAGDLFPNKATLEKQDLAEIFHAAAIDSWQEMKSALSSFMTQVGLVQLEALLSEISPVSLKNGDVGGVRDFIKKIAKVHSMGVDKKVAPEPEGFIKILYNLGVIYTRKFINGQPFYHSYHRGQPNYQRDGLVVIHRSIAKAFT